MGAAVGAVSACPDTNTFPALRVCPEPLLVARRANEAGFHRKTSEGSSYAGPRVTRAPDIGGMEEYGGRVVQLLLLLVVFFINVRCSSSTLGGSSGSSGSGKAAVLVLDVDGTLYEDDCEIESQIKENCHRWALENFKLSSDEAQALHEKWGATVRGVVETTGRSREVTYLEYYNQVYPNLDMSRVRKYHQSGSFSTAPSSGYSHGKSNLQKRRVLQALRHVKQPIVIASNSPIPHVKRVLTRLGLADLEVAAFITPEQRGGIIKTEAAFWDSLFQLFPKDTHTCTLVDDNALNVALARDLGMEATRITPTQTLADALLAFLHGVGGGDSCVFYETEYLASKNDVDATSISKDVLATLADELPRGKKSLSFVDLGAGTLSMLSSLLEEVVDKIDGVQSLTYVAFESNADALRLATEKRLEEQLGLVRDEEGSRWVGHYKKIMVTVHVVKEDFMTSKALATLNELLPPTPSEGSGPYTQSRPIVDLFCGCCMADLMAPEALSAQILELAGDEGGLLYLPITFAGSTRLLRQSATGKGKEDKMIFDEYHRHLQEDQGHHISPLHLADTLSGFGCSVLRIEPSNWVIDAQKHPYMFNCMLRFLAHGTTFRLLGQNKNNLDICQWFKDVRSASGSESMRIEVGTGDMLARLPKIKQALDRCTAVDKELLRPFQMQRAESFVEFTGPRQVRLVSEARRARCGPGQVLIRAVCSLVSTGTELKVFRGDFDSNEKKDLVFGGGGGDRLQFPLRYGYSLVGVVEKVGAGLSREEWIGRRVFSFSPHGTSCVVDADAVLPVPDDVVDMRDAAFLPSMETALSLVMDARPVVGEKLAVVGQGLIGQLVAAVMAKTSPNTLVTVFDTNPERINSAGSWLREFGVVSCCQEEVEPLFDAAIEVSGHPKGLQKAIDLCGSGGRVVLGSWFGEQPLPALHLGLRFHRSGIKLQASQVSNIPPEFRGRWNKQRRFDVAWKLIEELRPSQKMAMQIATKSVDHIQETFERLDEGKDLTALILYDSL